MTIIYGGDILIYYNFVLADPHGKSAVDGALFSGPTRSVASLSKIKSIYLVYKEL